MDEENRNREVPAPSTHEPNAGEERAEQSIVHKEEMLAAIMMQSGLPRMDTSDKVTSAHIDKMLDNEMKQSELQSKNNHENRWLTFGIVVMAIVFLVAMAVIFRDDVASMKEIITPVLSFLAGAGGGYGFGCWKSSRNSDDK